jgi:hypothetical protein
LFRPARQAYIKKRWELVQLLLPPALDKDEGCMLEVLLREILGRKR